MHSPTVLPPDFHHLLPGLWLWQAHDSSVKADLFSTAILTGSGVYIVDPIALADEELRQLSEAAPIAGIVVTNANHARTSSAYSDRFSVPIWANPRSFPDLKPARFTEAKEATPIAGELGATEVERAGTGEIALYHASN